MSECAKISGMIHADHRAGKFQCHIALFRLEKAFYSKNGLVLWTGHVPDPHRADAETHHRTSTDHRTDALHLGLVPDLVVAKEVVHAADLAVILGPTTKHSALWLVSHAAKITSGHTQTNWNREHSHTIVLCQSSHSNIRDTYSGWQQFGLCLGMFYVKRWRESNC